MSNFKIIDIDKNIEYGLIRINGVFDKTDDSIDIVKSSMTIKILINHDGDEKWYKVCYWLISREPTPTVDIWPYIQSQDDVIILSEDDKFDICDALRRSHINVVYELAQLSQGNVYHRVMLHC